MTSPLSPEAVAQMVADLDLFSRCGDVGVMDRDMAIDAKAMLTTLAADNATLRASEAAAHKQVVAQFNAGVKAAARAGLAHLDRHDYREDVTRQGLEDEMLAELRTLTPTADKE